MTSDLNKRVIFDGTHSGSETLDVDRATQAESLMPDQSFPNDHQPDFRHEYSRVPFTIFTIPKPFIGPTAVLQTNAISSWKRLHPSIDIILIGDDPGVAEYAARLNVGHQPKISRNRQGTPLLSSAFATAATIAQWPITVYCNCDVILLSDFTNTVSRLHQLFRPETSGPETSGPEFLAFGRRHDLLVERELDFSDPGQIEWLERELESFGQPAAVVCKEYFIFHRHQFNDLPDFAVGRGNWDNWMVHHCKQNGIPVIDVSRQTRAIHQAHDYSHLSRLPSEIPKAHPAIESVAHCQSELSSIGGSRAAEKRLTESVSVPAVIKKSRWSCYVAGEEAKENQRLAGGRHVIAGSTPTWVLANDQLKPVKFSWLNWRFYADLPRFLRLSWDLLKSR